MATQYHVYSNDHAGGPVDYTTPVATVAGLTWTSGALSAGSDSLYAVRAFDTVSGLEESNVDALARLIIDASRVDITARPGTPKDLTATPTAGGTCRVAWSYSPIAGGNPPASFKVWKTLGTSVNYAASPAATVPYSAGQILFHADLSGLADGSQYAIGVRAVNALADDGNTVQVLVTGDATGPAAVDGLAAALA